MFTDGMSRLTVGVSVMVALSIAVFLTIVILLLADLFCSHLRRRRLRADAAMPHKWRPEPSPPHTAGAPDDASVATTTTTTATHEALSSTPPFYYAHGVMCAPPSRKDLLLAIPKLEAAVWRWSPARRSSPSPSPSPSPPRSEHTARVSSSSAYNDGFLRISNPVYERGATAGCGGYEDTPFDTPEASPSPSGITEEEGAFSPPLPMIRKLSALGVLACPPPAVGFYDGRPPVTLWPGTVATDANRASSSSSNFTARFFSS
uniref:Uncharacterized protein n=1 Tax=Avena sativa TaxID=4498 RepID=A0ACD6AHT7_AVESA